MNKNKKSKVAKNKLFTIVNDHDGNESYSIVAKDASDAAHKALEELGWFVSDGEEIDVDKDGNCIYCGKECWDGEMCDDQQAGGFNEEK